MKKTDGKWQAQVWLPKGKSHYKFIVDGQWITDPANDVKERNEHNTFNSVIWLDAANN
jgi:1,4-alpha-glucan branching enzyme